MSGISTLVVIEALEPKELSAAPVERQKADFMGHHW
jgi:hypothetical protein